MILEFSDWMFFADTESTKEYAEQELAEHCKCGFCQNFYQVVDKTYPDLRYFLSRFGANIEAPESLIPISPELYQASYVVQGKILRIGSEPIWVHDIAITAEEEDPDWFILQLGIMNLPWSLPQDPDSIPKPYGLSDMILDIMKKKTADAL